MIMMVVFHKHLYQYINGIYLFFLGRD